MGTPAVPVVQIRVELGQPLAGFVTELHSAQALLVTEVGQVLHEIGLQGHPEIQISGGDSARPMSISIGDEPTRTPTATAAYAWNILAPPELAYLPWSGSPLDPAINQAVIAAMAAPELPHGLATRFLRAAITETIKDNIALVVGEPQVGAYVEAVSTPPLSSSVPETTIQSALRWMLDMDVGLTDPTALLESLHLSTQAGRSVDDAAEAAYRLLRPKSIQLEGHPDYLRVLFRGASIDRPTAALDESMDQSVRADHLAMVSAVRQDLGIELPVVVWVPSTDLQPGVIGVRINDRLVQRAGLAPDELFVLAKPDRLRVRGLDARPWPHPSTGVIFSAIPATSDSAALAKLFPVWDALGVAHRALYGEVERRSSRLVSIDVVEALVSRLNWTDPQLVRSVLARFSLGDLTRLLRALTTEGLFIGDLRGILERALLFETVEVATGHEMVLDDRVVVSPQDRNGPQSAQLVEFVRRGMLGGIAQRLTRDNNASVVVVHRVDPEVESMIATHSDSAESLVESVRKSLRDGGATCRPAVLTRDASRPRLRAAIAGALPMVAVISESELSPDTKVVAINREGGAMDVQVSLLRDRVGNLLVDFIGPGLRVDDDGDLSFEFEANRVFARVRMFAAERAIVDVFSITNRDVPPTPGLFHWVATHTDSWVFSHIGAEELVGGVTILVRHSLLGNFLDPGELFDAVSAVTSVAHEISGQIKAQFGGRLDREPSQQPQTESPGGSPNRLDA